MAKNTTAYYTKDGKIQTTTISSSTSTIFTAGAEGSKILSIYLTGTITAASIKLSAFDGTNTYDLVSKSVPVTGDDILALTKFPVNANGDKYFNIPNGWTLKLQVSGGDATVVVYGEDY